MIGSRRSVTATTGFGIVTGVLGKEGKRGIITSRSRRKQTKKKGQWGIRLGGVMGLAHWSNGSASVSPSVGFAEWLEPF